MRVLQRKIVVTSVRHDSISLASFKSLLNPESGSSLQNCPLDPTIQSTDSSEIKGIDAWYIRYK